MWNTDTRDWNLKGGLLAILFFWIQNIGAAFQPDGEGKHLSLMNRPYKAIYIYIYISYNLTAATTCKCNTCLYLQRQDNLTKPTSPEVFRGKPVNQIRRQIKHNQISYTEEELTNQAVKVWIGSNWIKVGSSWRVGVTVV